MVLAKLYFLSFASIQVSCNNFVSLFMSISFIAKESGTTARSPTKRAPDAGDSAHIPSSFTRLIIFLAGRLRRPRPSAGNANRWAASLRNQNMSIEILRNG